MSYRMALLAQRHACYWGGSPGVTTTSAEIPEELKPLVEGSTERMLEQQERMWGEDAELDVAGSDVRDVAGLSDAQKYGTNIKRIRDLGERSWGEQVGMRNVQGMEGMAGQRVTGDSIAGDPAMKAAFDTFSTFEKPMIEDSATQAGMGRSAQKGQKMSMGLQQMMLPQIQAAQGREERGLDRDMQSYMNAGNAAAGLGRDEVNRKRGALDYSLGAGDVKRKAEQEALDAPRDDRMRQRAWAESVLMGPFGSMVPSTIGSQVSSSGGK